MDVVIARRGRPKTVLKDNGTEPASNAILAWAGGRQVGWRNLASGKPQQDGSSYRLASPAFGSTER